MKSIAIFTTYLLKTALKIAKFEGFGDEVEIYKLSRASFRGHQLGWASLTDRVAGFMGVASSIGQQKKGEQIEGIPTAKVVVGEVITSREF